ncbi:subclass B3 metallo-beta-lactamase [Granulicella cerasi]|uniref:Subclass B3 metallo-beta-lactamase n=1 Tax=Granulicella cerasi TaxID=741063 RepID=A0ABW1Z9B3_9BACT|nr:subclass B3 metallo-beta-lactamase [Granulicella cerasi]
MLRRLVLCLLLLPALPCAFAATKPEWTHQLAPFQIADNLYYVGSEDLAAFLVVTPKGNILINANLVSSPPQIRASVEKLGFRWADTKILLNGQAHFDHMAGAAQVLRETHAKNMVMDADVPVIEGGGKGDFLEPTGSVEYFPPAPVDRVLHDGDTVTLGGVTLTAHKTPGHTRGCTTWTFRVHLKGEPAGKLRNVVIVGGTSFWSDFHFTAKPGVAESYPGIAKDFQHTFDVLHALPCDVFLGEHGRYFDLTAKFAKLKREPQLGEQVWIDPAGYKAFVDESEVTFHKALAKGQ